MMIYVSDNNMKVRREVTGILVFWGHYFVEEGDEILTLATKLSIHTNISRLSSERIEKK